VHNRFCGKWFLRRNDRRNHFRPLHGNLRHCAATRLHAAYALPEAPMAKPLPLPVWDRQQGKLVQEWMEDHQPHYESEPQRSLTQWVKSRPVYDRLYALYENSR
jgi:hypothetical protein